MKRFGSQFYNLKERGEEEDRNEHLYSFNFCNSSSDINYHVEWHNRIHVLDPNQGIMWIEEKERNNVGKTCKFRLCWEENGNFDMGFSRFMLTASWPFDSLVDVVISCDLAPSYYLIYLFRFIVICCLVQLEYVLVLPSPPCIIVANLLSKNELAILLYKWSVCWALW